MDNSNLGIVWQLNPFLSFQSLDTQKEDFLPIFLIFAREEEEEEEELALSHT